MEWKNSSHTHTHRIGEGKRDRYAVDDAIGKGKEENRENERNADRTGESESETMIAVTPFALRYSDCIRSIVCVCVHIRASIKSDTHRLSVGVKSRMAGNIWNRSSYKRFSDAMHV